MNVSSNAAVGGCTTCMTIKRASWSRAREQANWKALFDDCEKSVGYRIERIVDTPSSFEWVFTDKQDHPLGRKSGLAWTPTG
jgi:hypothetical protein